jgi:hypothetical protein
LDTPRWAGATTTSIPSEPARYARFTADVVRRYGPGGAFWHRHPEFAPLAPAWFELWNEPYLPQFSGGHVNPARYARLVAAAGAAGHRANPQARFLLAAETTWAGRTGRRDWVADLYTAVPGLTTSYDGVAVHPYTRGAPIDGDPATDFRRISSIAGALTTAGAPRRPFWITEIGWPTCSARPACVSEKRQARYIADVFKLATTQYKSLVHAVFIYHLGDGRPRAGRELREAHFGLRRLDGSHKPSWHTLRRVGGRD